MVVGFLFLRSVFKLAPIELQVSFSLLFSQKLRALILCHFNIGILPCFRIPNDHNAPINDPPDDSEQDQSLYDDHSDGEAHLHI